MFIVKSGNGYVVDSATLEMIGGCGAEMQAQRMNADDAARTIKRLDANGIAADLAEVRIGRIIK